MLYLENHYCSDSYKVVKNEPQPTHGQYEINCVFIMAQE